MYGHIWSSGPQGVRSGCGPRRVPGPWRVPSPSRGRPPAGRLPRCRPLFHRHGQRTDFYNFCQESPGCWKECPRGRLVWPGGGGIMGGRREQGEATRPGSSPYCLLPRVGACIGFVSLVGDEHMRTSFAVLGDGAWGTAIALLLAQNPRHRVALWSAREENGRILRERRENVRLLPGVPIPESVDADHRHRPRPSAGADLWVAAIPTVYLRATLRPHCAGELRRGPPVLSLAKGLENDTFLRPTRDPRRRCSGVEQVAVLSGPSHAEEVSRGLPTSRGRRQQRHGAGPLDSAALSAPTASASTPTSTWWASSWAGALKNVIGIAAGISDGLGFGDNAKAALLTRGLVEMTRFGVALGAEPQTFSGLAGMGDLITTCISRHGRNRHVGERLARGEKTGRHPGRHDAWWPRASTRPAASTSGPCRWASTCRSRPRFTASCTRTRTRAPPSTT